MSHDHDPPDWDGEYATILKRMGVDLADDRKGQVKAALDADGEDMATILRRVMKEHNGRTNTARKAVNNQLRAADHYDDDEYGVISETTFYGWCDEHGVDIDS